jgi:hypothetical protein
VLGIAKNCPCNSKCPSAKGSDSAQTQLGLCMPFVQASLPSCQLGSPHGLARNMWGTSVATVMTDVFHKNEINLLRKFAKIVRIFDKIDDPQNRGVI